MVDCYLIQKISHLSRVRSEQKGFSGRKLASEASRTAVLLRVQALKCEESSLKSIELLLVPPFYTGNSSTED